MNNIDIKNLINVFLKKNRLENGLLDLEVKKVWFEVMDNGIANYTRDVNLKNKTLYVKLNSPALREELSYGKEKLINIINHVEDFMNKNLDYFDKIHHECSFDPHMRNRHL